MSVKLAASADGLTIELQNGAGAALLRFDSSGVAEFPEAENVYTKTTAGALASLALAAGGIMETGSNADGEFIKFANGWAINTKTISGLGPVNSLWGTAWYISTAESGGNFALPFIGVPLYESVSVSSTSSDLSTSGFSSAATSTAFGEFYIMRGSATSNTNFVAKLVSIGRWKA